MGISIKNDRAEKLARQVAAETGKASPMSSSRPGDPFPI